MPSRVTITATARCHTCGVLTAGDAAGTDRKAEQHTRDTGHVTAVMATPVPA